MQPDVAPPPKRLRGIGRRILINAGIITMLSATRTGALYAAPEVVGNLFTAPAGVGGLITGRSSPR